MIPLKNISVMKFFKKKLIIWHNDILKYSLIGIYLFCSIVVYNRLVKLFNLKKKILN